MKFNSLRFGKAISAALFVLLLVVVGTKNALAQNQVATLQHNDTITGVFYGQNAYSSAYDAAVDGDVITLSSGTFNSGFNINKSITIRGAGCVYDSTTQITPTIFPDDFFLGRNNNTNNVSFEGIWFTGTIKSWGYHQNNNVSFLKCNINKIGDFYREGERMNWQIINCIVKEINTENNDYLLHGLSIINSVVRFTRYSHTDLYNPNSIYNSVIVFADGLPTNNLIAYNSIITTVSGHNVSNCIFFNCINIKTGETSLFEGQTVQNVMEVDG